jgi:hypothetical protein
MMDTRGSQANLSGEYSKQGKSTNTIRRIGLAEGQSRQEQPGLPIGRYERDMSSG